MQMNDAVLTKLSVDLRSPLQDFATMIDEQVGPRLVGLTLFGAALDAGHPASHEAARTVLVLDKVDLEVLRRISMGGARWGRKHIAAPLIMTEQFIKASLDSFPLELIEIVQRRATLAGRDCFDGLTFEVQDVRLQCERELKRIKMRVQQGVLAATGKAALLGELQEDVGAHTIRTLRGLLWIKGHRDFLSASMVIEECEKLSSRGLSGLRTALSPKSEHGWRELVALYQDVEALAGIANCE
jgi:hypothetical protein